VANIPNSSTSSVPSDIQRILDHSVELCERSIQLREKSESETTYLQELIRMSLQLDEAGKRLRSGNRRSIRRRGGGFDPIPLACGISPDSTP